MKKIILILAAKILFVAPSVVAQEGLAKLLQEAVGKESSDTTPVEKKKYSDVITQEAVTFKGIVDIHRVKQVYYLEIPRSLLGKPMLLAGRVSEGSHNREIIAGAMPAQPRLVEWDADDDKVYLLDAENIAAVDPAETIAIGFRRNNIKPVMKAFPVKALSPDSALVIDVSKFFCGDEKHLSPFAPLNPLDLLLGVSRLKGTFKPELSAILSCKSFPENFTFRTRMAYTVSDAPFTAVMTTSMILLPDAPMRPRISDKRLGFFTDKQKRYSENKNRLEPVSFDNRWRLEPTPDDRERHERGEKVIPERPIVFYIDRAFPAAWRPWLKEGVEDWQAAFEEIGFKQAIVARDYPDDEQFDPDDTRRSCLVYASVPIANAMGPSWTDPRSGEIINASVYFYHNVLKLLHDWRFIQTATVDPAARAEVYDMEVMGPLLRYLVAHEIGHTLGLMHNMRGSYAYAVDSLRSPSFTAKHGTTASIMDYARYNYVAQPGDGVTWLLPPRLGPYDIFAIGWAYRLIPGANSPEEEKPVLNRWLVEKQNDPRFRYGMQEILGTVDPAASSESLGDDAIKATRLGIANLKVLATRLVEWTARDGEDLAYTQEMWGEVVKQFVRYLGHVEKYIGGKFLEYPVHGDGKTAAFIPVPREKQREALAYIIASLKECPSWLLDKGLMALLEPGNDKINDIIVDYVRDLSSPSKLGKIGYTAKYSDDPYTQDEYLRDLYSLLFEKTIAGEAPSWGERNMQYAFVHSLFGALDLYQPDVKATRDRFDEIAFLYYDLTPASLSRYLDQLSARELTSATNESDVKINSRRIYHARLLDVKKLLDKRVKSARGEVKEHYAYLLHEINKALDEH